MKKINNILKGEIISSVFLYTAGTLPDPDPHADGGRDLQSSIRADPHRSWHLSYLYLHTWKSESYDHGSSKWCGVFCAGGVLFMTPSIVIKLLPWMLSAFVLVDSLWKFKGAFLLEKKEETAHGACF